MRFSRLIPASLLVAAVTVLASCGGSTTPTATNATDPSLGTGTREYSLSANPTWQKEPEDPIPTDTKTVLISGVIAVGSYPQFGPPVYAGANNWLDIVLTQNFSRAPLGWIVSFKLKPAAQSLPIGSYTMTMAVNVPAALNNPQNIVVTFTNCGNCLFLGSVRPGDITAISPTWDRGNSFNNTGSYSYKDWRLFLDPGQTAWVQQIGGSYELCSETGPLGDQSDPNLYIFDVPTVLGNPYLFYNDDWCGYSSQVGPITNGTGVRKEYLVRATQYSSGITSGNGVGGYNAVGTYTMRVVSVPFGGSSAVREQTPADIAKKNSH